MWHRIAVVLFLAPNAVLAAYTVPKPGTYYTLEQVGIQEKELKGSQLHLTFKPLDEQFHWCPGVKIQTTKKATIVTFVRCETSKNCSIDKKATIEKRLIRTIAIDTKGKDIYVLNGPKKFTRIYQAPPAASSAEESKTQQRTKKTQPKKISSQQTNRVWVTNSYVRSVTELPH